VEDADKFQSPQESNESNQSKQAGTISPFSISKVTKPRRSRLKLQQKKSDQTLGKGSLVEG